MLCIHCSDCKEFYKNKALLLQPPVSRMMTSSWGWLSTQHRIRLEKQDSGQTDWHFPGSSMSGEGRDEKQWTQSLNSALCVQISCMAHMIPHFIFKTTIKAGITSPILLVGRLKNAQDHSLTKRRRLRSFPTHRTISPASPFLSLWILKSKLPIRSKPCLATSLARTKI